MKKNIEIPKIQVIELDARDVIVTSGPNGGDFTDQRSDPEQVQVRRSVFED